jgi:hypothetical protein
VLGGLAADQAQRKRSKLHLMISRKRGGCHPSGKEGG